MHIDFALPTNGDLAQGFLDYEKKAAKSVMDYGFHMAVTTWNDKVAEDMEDLVKKGGLSKSGFDVVLWMGLRAPPWRSVGMLLQYFLAPVLDLLTLLCTANRPLTLFRRHQLVISFLRTRVRAHGDRRAFADKVS